MPSLADSLANLALQSEQITHLASLNARPAGPYTQAYLHLPQSLSAQVGVTGLIRDASEAEVRLFKFIGETDPSTGSATAAGGEKRIEKRDGVMVTPLKEVKRRREEGTASVDFVLQKALRLVDDYRPMPRARAHIANLLQVHSQQLERIAELERQISEATNPSKPTVKAASPAPAEKSSPQALKMLSPDEAIKAEEESIKALEQSLLPLRRAVSVKPSSGSPAASPAKSPAHIRSPARPQAGGAIATQTPAKTPLPNITNSLVNGTTPHRSVAAHQGPLNRFSPLRLLGTPKAGAGPSSLRQETDRSIFGKRLNRSTNRSTPAPLELRRSQQDGANASKPAAHDDAEAEVGDETIRIKRAPVELAEPISPAPKRTPTKPATPKSVVSPSGSTPTKMRSPMRRRVEGVDVSLESVRVSVAKIWETLGDLMRTGTKEPTSTSVEDTVKHLHHLSMSDPAPPPSPSSASSSTLTSAPGAPPTAKAIPVKSQDILVAHLCLLLLRAASPGNADGGVAMADVKERLGAIAKARGWDGAAEQGTKVVYTAVAKRTVRIDRRGGAGGRVKFAD